MRERLEAQGLHPVLAAVGVDIDRWLRRAATPWDAFPRHPQRQARRRDRTPGQALRSPDVTLVTGALVEHLLLAPDGRRIEGVEYRQRGERRVLRAGTVVLLPPVR